MRAAVVALGDLGRCARMVYHAHALAASGVDVDLVGFEGTPLPRAVAEHSRIAIHRLNPATLRLRGGFSGSGYAVAGLFDAARLSFRLWSALRRAGVKFVIDWHNLGFTMLSARLGRWHPAVRLARWFERRDARRVEANLCVSRGLAAFLESRFGVHNTRVLYDRPASSFVPMDRAER